MKKTESVATFAKGRVDVYQFDNFKLHVYYTNDVMADASFIIEGSDKLVTLEQPLFKDNVAEYDDYLDGLGKPVEVRIANYHLGGTAHHHITMPEGMPSFTKGDVYGGMMKGFAQMFGDTITDLPTGETTEIAFGKVYEFASVKFEVRCGAASDFPGASLLIGGKVYYTHWAPAKAHISALQIGSREAVGAEIEESRNALASGAELFIGGHGGATDAENVQFKIDYLCDVQRLMNESASAEDFVRAMKLAYPNLPCEENLEALAKNVCR